MEVISVSLDTELLAELSRAQKTLGVKSRSKVLRQGVKALLHEYAALDKLEGIVDLVVTIAHAHKGEEALMKATHDFEHVIETRLHKSTKSGCVDILVIHGNARDAKQLVKTLKASKQLEAVFFTAI